MNKYIALSLFILFALGCQEDSIIETSSEELSDPVIVESTLLEGKVTSISNEGLSDVVVDLFQSSEHIGQVITDGNGSYTSEGIAILPDVEVTLKYSKEEYILKQRRVNIQTTRVTSDVTLALEAEVNSRIDQEIIADAADTSLVRVFGYCLLQDGTPVPGVSCTALWEYDCFGTNTLFLSKAFRDISDQDGYFECYVEKDIEILFDAELWRFPIGVDSASQFFRTDCIEPFSLSEPVGPDCTGSHGFISLGNIIEDTEVEMRDDIVFEELKSLVTGRAVRCDGSPATRGDILANLGFLLAVSTEEAYEFGPNGEFEILLETCPYDGNEELFVSIGIEDTEAFLSGSKRQTYAETVDIGEVVLCIDERDYPDEFEFSFGNDIPVEFPSGGDSKNSEAGELVTSFSFKQGDLKETIFLAIDDVKLGENSIRWIRYWRSERQSSGVYQVIETWFSYDEPTTLIADITDIDGRWITGTLIGELSTITTPSQNVNCSFRIFDKGN